MRCLGVCDTWLPGIWGMWTHTFKLVAAAAHFVTLCTLGRAPPVHESLPVALLASPDALGYTADTPPASATHPRWCCSRMAAWTPTRRTRWVMARVWMPWAAGAAGAAGKRARPLIPHACHGTLALVALEADVIMEDCMTCRNMLDRV